MKKTKVLNLFTLLWVTAAFNVSIRNLGIFATTSMHMIFFAVVTLAVFYLPIALVTAEMATTFPKMGGIAVWVKEAFGKKIGLLAIWLQWTYMNIAMIAMLYFISASLSFVFAPHLVHNKAYLISMNIILIWLFTFFNLRGLKISTKISQTFFILGILIPAILIIGLGVIYVVQAKPIQIDTTFSVKNYLPDFHLTTLVILIGFMRAFGGIEGSAVHANSVENPKKNYPLAIFFAVTLGFLINILGSMSLAFVIPQKDISLIGGVMHAFSIYFTKYNLKFLIPLLGLLVAIGQMGGFSTWLAGPVKGLLETAKAGELPVFFQKVNKNNMPSNLMIIQAIVISISSTTFLLVSSSINMSFWISVALSMMIYVSMYFLMILSCLSLRYKKPDIQRVFKIPFKNFGLWLVSILGMMTMVFAFVMALIPPNQLEKENSLKYFLILIISVIIVYIIPFLIHRLKKESWFVKSK
ncbi:MAG: Glutamate/gamma-aminobutyrate antiporter [Candidatus Anoxychlamydiales bacterium]|nr:Glutamate/gamma-aminobutyrate antiporter [Candidatus Anoxychlamydiales bacterium]